jgi:hypothetical protein
MAGTAMWHFAVLVPDRFYRGIIGSLVVANVGAIFAGLAGAGFVLPSDTALADALLALAGAFVALDVSSLSHPIGLAVRLVPRRRRSGSYARNR